MNGMIGGPSNLFVYGSLRPGGGVFHRFLGGFALRVVEATLDGFALYGRGLPYPFIAPEEGGLVHGEVVAIDPERMAEVIGSLDFYEGPEYRRIVVHPVTDSGETLDAWAFAAAPSVPLDAAGRIPGGDWLDASSR